ncbi:MAG TPA: hypothetical protein VJN67_17805 [Stellaceae bacterium]|nr:hypothetical protein [Stellaceae bacterium]
MEFAKIVLFSLLAAIAYGIAQDQVTAHLCVEYFTVAHPAVFPTRSPFLLAIGWGILATWWVGLPLGLLLATASRFGARRRLVLADVRSLILRLLAFAALSAIVAGVLGAYLFATGEIRVPGGWAAVIPPEKHTAFTADAWAHLASYTSGIVGGVVVVGCALVQRFRRGGIDTVTRSA